MPNEDNHLEYRFKSRSTGVAVDIGVGDESSTNPGQIVTKEETVAQDNLTVQVPAQNKLFTMYNAVNYGSYPDPVEDDHKFWFTTSDNLFKSLNFSKGISSFTQVT